MNRITRNLIITIVCWITLGDLRANGTGDNSTIKDETMKNETIKDEIIKNPRIVIIGAGAAGIAAASELFQSGFKNVTILEAEDRIGGRIYTTEFGNYSVDLGAQWVHGENRDVAYKTAFELGFLEKTDKPYYGMTQKFFDSLGNALGEKVEKNITEFYLKYTDNTDFGNTTSYKSVGDYIEKMFDKEYMNNSNIYPDKKKFLNHFEVFRNSLESADSWHNISLTDGGYEDYPGDQMINWKTRGYSTILDILMKRIPEPEKELPIVKNTIFGSEVISIDYLNNTEKGGPSILILTGKNQLYQADHVIVTVSLGVLKEKYKSLFIPPLPEEKVKAIENLGFGNVAKIYALFEKPFWDVGESRSLYFDFLWNDIDRQSIENDTEKSWILGMSGAMTVDHKPNLLEIWITGKYAWDMEKLPEDQVFNHTIENLQRFLGKKYQVPKPVKLLRTRWYSNPHFRGTYSFVSTKTQEAKVEPEMLEQPINSPRNLTVLFAGEATSSNRFSTVDGAISSGRIAAKRLIEHYKDILKSDD